MEKYVLSGTFVANGITFDLDTIEFTFEDWNTKFRHMVAKHEPSCAARMDEQSRALLYRGIALSLDKLEGSCIPQGWFYGAYGVRWCITRRPVEYRVCTVPGKSNPLTAMDVVIKNKDGVGCTLLELLFGGKGNTVASYLELHKFIGEVCRQIDNDAGEWDLTAEIDGNVIMVWAVQN